MERRGYYVIEQKKTLMIITLQSGKIIKDYLTQAQVRGIMKTEIVIGIRRG